MRVTYIYRKRKRKRKTERQRDREFERKMASLRRRYTGSFPFNGMGEEKAEEGEEGGTEDVSSRDFVSVVEAFLLPAEGKSFMLRLLIGDEESAD